MKLTVQEIKNLELGGLLHDIGMIRINESIVTKKGPLNDDETDMMRKHTVVSTELLEHIIYLRPVIPYVLYHHERFDGSGYPEKLSGTDIPLGSRIIAIAEVFDALTSERPYRDKIPMNDAVDHIRNRAGSDFDPEVVQAFLKAVKQKKI